jgi:hypothetical protein
MSYFVLTFIAWKSKNKKQEHQYFSQDQKRNRIHSIRLTVPIHTDLVFKEQAKVKGLSKGELSQSHYSIQHIEEYDKDNQQDLHFSIIGPDDKELYHGTMNIHFI